MPKLAIVDDEPNVLYSLRAGLESDDLEVVTAPTGQQGVRLVEREQPDVAIVDVRLPDMTGLELVDRLKGLDPRLPVVVVTAFGAAETAIEAMKRGAFEYLLKPVDLHQLREVIGRAVELRRMQTVPAVFGEVATAPSADQIIGRSAAMQAVYKAVGRVARQDVTVLLLGESGTGKELVARAIYQHSDRADRPFLAVNCAAIPDALLESELFGHERGAFTGADRQRIGKFEQAHGGTLFLDEVGDMTLAAQAKLLRVLQDQRFERVGGQETVAADVRVIAATNQQLEEKVAAGSFRQDLLYRLNGVVIHLPPLRERKEDIPLLTEHLVRLANDRLGRNVRSIAPEALRLLKSHAWPGNVRELQNAVRYAVLQATGEVLTPDCLPASVRGQPAAGEMRGKAEELDVVRLVLQFLESGESDIYRRVISEVDRVVLAQVMRRVGGNQVHASELLGISRTTLRAKLAAAGLERPTG